MKKEDVIRLDVEKKDIIEAISLAKEKRFSDNLRRRTDIVSFDSKVRGYLGEIAIRKWFVSQGITDFKSNMLGESCDIDLTIFYNNSSFSCEVKTSKIPEFTKGEIDNIIRECDIKIIKRYDNVMVDRDIYIQIYYNLFTKAHDAELEQKFSQTEVGETATAEEIYNTYNYERYLTGVFFYAWDNKENIERRLNSLLPNQRTYTISKRTFFVCKLKDSLAPIDIVNYIKTH